MSRPARLHRKENSSVKNRVSYIEWLFDHIEAWVLSHALLCLIVAICMLMALFVALIFTLTGVSATDSGVVYNQFNNIV